MRPLSLLAALLLASCGFPDDLIDPSRYKTDASGYLLPQHCRAQPEPVSMVYHLPRSRIREQLGRDVNAYYHVPTGSVAIADDLAGWRYADTMRHEEWHGYCEQTKDACCVGHFAPRGK